MTSKKKATPPPAPQLVALLPAGPQDVTLGDVLEALVNISNRSAVLANYLSEFGGGKECEEARAHMDAALEETTRVLGAWPR